MSEMSRGAKDEWFGVKSFRKKKKKSSGAAALWPTTAPEELQPPSHLSSPTVCFLERRESFSLSLT